MRRLVLSSRSLSFSVPEKAGPDAVCRFGGGIYPKRCLAGADPALGGITALGNTQGFGPVELQPAKKEGSPGATVYPRPCASWLARHSSTAPPRPTFQAILLPFAPL